MINTALDSANILLRPGEAIAAAIALAAVTGGLVAVFLMRSLLWGGVVFLAAVLIVFALIERAGQQERSKFEKQLPDTLTLMATSLRAGYSLVQAVESVAGESPNPTGREFGRAVAETRLGRPAVQALQGISDRMERGLPLDRDGGRDPARGGGNLSEVLQTVADTMLARNRLRGEVRALTAEGRDVGDRARPHTGGALHIPLLTNLLLPGPAAHRSDRSSGARGPGLLMVAGVFWLRRLVKIEVSTMEWSLLVAVVLVFVAVATWGYGSEVAWSGPAPRRPRAGWRSTGERAARRVPA